jgi:hypothetical protein
MRGKKALKTKLLIAERRRKKLIEREVRQMVKAIIWANKKIIEAITEGANIAIRLIHEYSELNKEMYADRT